MVNGNVQIAKEREPRHLTDLEWVTIRLYNIGEGHGYWYYNEYVIQGSQLWEETLYLMSDIRDLWYEGTILYVDLMPMTPDGGAIHGWLTTGRLHRTFSSFPHVSEIRFLTNGRPGIPVNYQGAGISHVFDVEKGRTLTQCEIDMTDPWFYTNATFRNMSQENCD